ncbi:gamma-mobile-trio protein GmtX [Shewanella sp. SP2S2-6]|uniref:gamma-mobile-trio protein GmtX n=1 Tax=Shewanella sp. SP2S2-6 TaxID=3063540 RepID=UPI0028917B70|nr:gamma-mobile-trio protein GmtX [Shewanella sp. SP2S2-6]MDT3295941.1 gamma-mobile-trio protein GmtX [Shewanella sp. SP2S2-6]
MTPEDTFERLMSDASDPRRKRSLEALNEVCGLLYERKSLDFTYDNIILLGNDRGLLIPGKKSLVNSTGLHYRELIFAWKHRAREHIQPNLEKDRWVEDITDPVARMSVHMLLNEVKALKAKRARKAQHDGILTISNSYGTNKPFQNLVFSSSELNALSASIDPEVLKLHGLCIGSRGELLDSSGRTVFKPGFRDAIEKILTVKKERV